jgi:hypothetical protein
VAASSAAKQRMMVMSDEVQPCWNLHDASLLSISVNWEKGTAAFEIRTAKGVTSFMAIGLKELHVPRHFDWGPSVSIYTTTGPVLVASGLLTLSIQMQSGDDIKLIANEFDGCIRSIPA